MPGRSEPQGGFTLIEALVAFVMLATLLSVMGRVVVQARTGAYSAVKRDHQVIVAQAILNEFLARHDLKPNVYHGISLGLHWTAKVDGFAPAVATSGPRKSKIAWRPCRIDFSIETGRARPLHIETIRLIADEPT